MEANANLAYKASLELLSAYKGKNFEKLRTWKYDPPWRLDDWKDFNLAQNSVVPNSHQMQ